MLQGDVGILVVDDVNTMRVQIKELLRGFGFKRVMMAANGTEALLLLASESVQLILCDWHMSPIDGLELLSFVRSDEKLKGLPFIMVTAENTREMVIEAIRSGIDDYLMKPLTPAQIESKVYSVLIKKQVL